MVTVRLAKRNSDRIENDIKFNRLKIHLQIKNVTFYTISTVH